MSRFVDADVMLSKYLRPSALRGTASEVYQAYLGKNSTSADHEAFMEYVDTEFLSNECSRLNSVTVAKVGVFSLLDGMPSLSKGRPPSLTSLLRDDAYQDGNTATYDYYLGERRTREEEQEFRHRLAFIKDMFDQPVDEARAQAVAEYMLGPVKEEDEGSEEEDGSESESSASENESDDDDEEERDRDRNHDRHHRSTRRYRDESEEEDEEEDGSRRGRHTTKRQRSYR